MSNENSRAGGVKAILVRWLPFGILGGIVIVAVSALLVARWTSPDRVEVDLTVSEPTANEESAAVQTQDIRIAVGSMLTPTSNFEAYGELIELIGARLGRRSSLYQRETYGQVNELVRRGEVDIAFVCSGAYIPMRDEGSAELLAVPVVDGQSTYFSMIVARAGLPAERMEDLRGTTFAFVDPLSNTGFYYPTWRIRTLGESTDSFFGETTFTHSHESSVDMVVEGVVDAAAVDNLVFETMADARPEIRGAIQYIENSDRFGIPPVVVRTGLSPDLKQAARRALLEMHETPEGRSALLRLGFDRFKEGADEHYDSVQRMIADTDTIEAVEDAETGTP